MTTAEVNTLKQTITTFKNESSYIGDTESAMIMLQEATKTRLYIITSFFILSAFLLVYFFYIEPRIHYSNIITVVDSAKLNVSGLNTAIALEFPILKGWCGFNENSQFPEAMFISLNMPQYNYVFAKNPVQNTQQMFSNDMYGISNKTAKDLACASYMGDANLCLPPCTSNSATPASYASSMISTGISMAMSGGEMGGPVGAVAGLLAGLGIGAGLTKLGSMNSPPCAS